MRIFTIIIRTVVAIVLLLFICARINDIDLVIHFLAEKLNLTVSPEKIINFLPHKKYIQLINLSIVLLSLFFLSTWYFKTLLQWAVSLFSDLINSLKRILSSILKDKGALVLVLPIVATLYYVIHMPIHGEETYTYEYFTSQGILSSYLFYPAPNNHVLHSIITNITSEFPLLHPTIKMRFGPFFASLCSSVLMYYSLRKHYNQWVAVFVVATSLLMFYGLYFNFLSRGYALQMLAFVGAFHFLHNIIKDNNKRNWLWFILFQIIGIITLPSFIYGICILHLFLLIQQPNLFKRLIVSYCLILVIGFLFYTPIFIINGFEAVFANKFIERYPLSTMVKESLNYYSTLNYRITGLPWLLVASLLLLSVFMLMLKRKYRQFIVIIYFVLMPLLLAFATHIFPFSRVFNYYAFLIPLLIFLPLQFVKMKMKMHVVLGLFFVQIFLLFNFKKQLYITDGIFFDAEKVIPKIAGNYSYFDAGGIFSYPFKYYLATNNISVKSVDFNEHATNIDTLKGYDFIIVEKRLDSTRIHKPIYSLPNINVYRLDTVNGSDSIK